MLVLSVRVVFNSSKDRAESVLNRVLDIDENIVDWFLDSVEPDCDVDGQLSSRTVIDFRVVMDACNAEKAKSALGFLIDFAITPVAWSIERVVVGSACCDADFL